MILVVLVGHERHQPEVDDLSLHLLLDEDDADVLLVEVVVDDSHLVKPQDGGAHLRNDVLQLGLRQQLLLDALLERSASVEAYDGLLLPLDHDGLDLLRPLNAPNFRQGFYLLQEGLLAGGRHPLHDQAATGVGEQLDLPVEAAAQERRAAALGVLEEVGRGPHGHLEGLELSEKLLFAEGRHRRELGKG